MAEAAKKQLELEKLVDELMKDEPNHQIVRQLSTQLGIPYSRDPMTQMNTVLQSLSSTFVQSRIQPDLER